MHVAHIRHMPSITMLGRHEDGRSERCAKAVVAVHGTGPGIPSSLMGCTPVVRHKTVPYFLCLTFGVHSTYENSLFGRNNSLFREQQGIACKLLKLLNDSPLLREQGMLCRRLKLLDELTPTSAIIPGNFANSLLF